MKPRSALLLWVMLLGSCATPMHTLTTPGLPDVCKKTKGIYALLIDYSGNVLELPCDDINGKQIFKKSRADPGLKQGGAPIPLGEVVKLKADTDSDPCIQWSVGGNIQYYCW